MGHIAHHGFEGICEICGLRIPGGRRKLEHYQSVHPEIKFSRYRKPSVGQQRAKSVYKCELCTNLIAASNYAVIVKHIKENHPEILKGKIWLRSKECKKVEHASNPIQQVDKFFDGLTTVMLEVEKLRREKNEWMAVAEKWANKIVELQELMGRKP